MRRAIPLGQIIRDQFPIWEADGFAKRSGETGFVTSAWRDGEPVELDVTVEEIGRSGEYLITYTPEEIGLWMVEVKVPYNNAAWASQSLVVPPGEEGPREVYLRLGTRLSEPLRVTLKNSGKGGLK